MKNLMVYLNPAKKFGKSYAALVKVQIEHSLSMGWKPEDILIVTNFEYEYNGVEALVVDDSLFCAHRKRASKINVIYYLLNKRILKELCWFHDIDAFQLYPITEEELGLNGVGAGFTDYGPFPNSNWNTGSFFFKPESKDIFKWIRHNVYQYRTNEESALFILTKKNTNDINTRIKKLNCTYNLCTKRYVEECYKGAIKPVRVLHFHPGIVETYKKIKQWIPKTLIDILELHGYPNPN